ncbi:hypothetical protein LCGC14_1923480, partial [marine sediment metagenome]
MWRPDDWEKVKPRKLSKGVKGISEPNFDYGVEAGADAMVKAILEELEKCYTINIDSTFFWNPAMVR